MKNKENGGSINVALAALMELLKTSKEELKGVNKDLIPSFVTHVDEFSLDDCFTMNDILTAVMDEGKEDELAELLKPFFVFLCGGIHFPMLPHPAFAYSTRC